MAFVVGRRDGRFEIRESVSTASGPRARTLAAFRVLTNDVVSSAAARARRPFDATKIRARARELGAPIHQGGAVASAARLLAQLRAGESLPPALADELRRALPGTSATPPYSPMGGPLDWLGIDDATRGRALRDLLALASQLPQRRRPEASLFPRISSRVDA